MTRLNALHPCYLAPHLSCCPNLIGKLQLVCSNSISMHVVLREVRDILFCSSYTLVQHAYHCRHGSLHGSVTEQMMLGLVTGGGSLKNSQTQPSLHKRLSAALLLLNKYSQGKRVLTRKKLNWSLMKSSSPFTRL